MANISNTDLTINWLPNVSKANSTTQFNAINQIKASIITLGLMADDVYGLSREVWLNLSTDFEKSYTDPEQINNQTYTLAQGRWSFSGSVTNSSITALIDTLSNPVSTEILQPFTYLLTNSVIVNLRQPYTDEKYIESFYSFLPTATVSLLKNQHVSMRQKLMIVASLNHAIINAAELLYKEGVFDDNNEEISLLNVSYNDYEPGVDFLEVGGEFTLMYDTTTETLSYIQLDGDVIDNPSNDDLYEHNFSDMSSDEIAKEYLDMLDLHKTVENLKLTDEVIEEICDNFTISTYMIEEIDSYIEEFTSITTHVMGIISSAINDLETKQRIEKIINELDEIPPLDDYALESKINSFLEIIA